MCEYVRIIWVDIMPCLNIVTRNGKIAAKSSPLGGIADTFMPIFSPDTLDFLVYNRYIPRRGNNTFFLVT